MAFGSLGIAGLSLLLFAGADKGMPGLVTDNGEDLPAEVEQVAREIFDGRFAKHRDSYYTLAVHYVPNRSSELASVNQMMGGLETRLKAGAGGIGRIAAPHPIK